MVLLVLVTFILIGIFGADPKPANTTSPATLSIRRPLVDTPVADAAPAEPPPATITARELYRAYDANEAAAQRRFGDRPLTVTGVIKSIELDYSDEPFLTLATGEMLATVRAELARAQQAKADGLRKGQSVKLTCASVSELMGSPQLKDCSIG